MAKPTMSAISASGSEARPLSGFLRRLCAALAYSPLLRRGRQKWEENQKNVHLPLAKWDKLWTGAYLILSDFSQGAFPPTFNDQQQAYLNEINTRISRPGLSVEEFDRNQMAKPFWPNPSLEMYLGGFLRMVRAFDAVNLRPPAKLLELGGGAGWTAEFLVQLGYDVISTTISPDDVALGAKRVEALRVKGVSSRLDFVVAPMETVATHVSPHAPFDGVFVFEALHHAFDWRAAISSACSCLKPGGWLLLCNEPNVLHTAIAYRIARLTTTHEIGFHKPTLIRHLKSTGFRKVISLGKRPHFFVHPHWLVAQKE